MARNKQAAVVKKNPTSALKEFRLDEGKTSGWIVSEGEMRNNNFVVYEDGTLGFDYWVSAEELSDTIELARKHGADVASKGQHMKSAIDRALGV